MVSIAFDGNATCSFVEIATIRACDRRRIRHTPASSELRCAPYYLVLRHDGDRDRSIELADLVRSTIRFNRSTSMRAELRARVTGFVAWARRKGRWVLHRAIVGGASRS